MFIPTQGKPKVTVRMPSGALKLASLTEQSGRAAVDMDGYIFSLTIKQVKTANKKGLVIY
jgi:hypothetical protein